MDRKNLNMTQSSQSASKSLKKLSEYLTIHDNVTVNQNATWSKNHGKPDQKVKMTKPFINRNPTTETSGFASSFTNSEVEVALIPLKKGKAKDDR